MVPERSSVVGGGGEGLTESVSVMGFQLMCLAHEGDTEGIRELLDVCADLNFRDSDGRTALQIGAFNYLPLLTFKLSLQIASCEGHAEVIELLLGRGAEDVAEDRWGPDVCFTHLVPLSLPWINVLWRCSLRGQTLKRKNQKALFETLLKVKDELMLLGFISLLLTVFQGILRKTCIPPKWTNHLLPCRKMEEQRFINGNTEKMTFRKKMQEMMHCQTNPKFDFRRYMVRALEADFRKVVGISWYLWIFIVIFLLLNVNGMLFLQQMKFLGSQNYYLHLLHAELVVSLLPVSFHAAIASFHAAIARRFV
ncbi:hypothetical protein GUJ93_ZPchr0012g20259 [Zizania palustris]|uniref:Ion transport domain-containing protein n=1 Tax=Zizania palustris TaxID=103762 RepID=A0A8J5WTP5_ZIZPA|nr:hypothetical protein GUJ93_ZPchr0012g20259 [Zizania palustris]